MQIENKFIKEILFNYLSKIILMGVGFLSIPLLIKYLGSEKYGLWVTTMSVISWAQITDFGMGNGLRNKVTENFTQKNIKLLNKYISTAYIFLSKLSLIIFIIGIIILYQLDYKNIFNTNIDTFEIKLSLIITLFSFSINFILGLIKSIANAIHKSYLVGFSQVIYSFLVILMIFFLLNIDSDRSLVNVSLVYLIATTLANIFLSIRVFKIKYLKPIVEMYSPKLINEIFGIGIQFFIIQLCLLVLFSTDSIIITKLLGSQHVTKYSLIEKIFGTIVNLYSILLIGLWSKVSGLYSEKKIESIKRLLNKFKLTLLPTIMLTIFVFIFVNKIISLWINIPIEYDLITRVVFLIHTILMIWSGISLNIVNGIGKVKLQMYIYIVGAILNIPLSIYFIKYLNLGIVGVKLATLICLLPIGIFIPLQVKKLLKS